MASAAGLTRGRAADFFGKSTYLRGCGGHTGVLPSVLLLRGTTFRRWPVRQLQILGGHHRIVERGGWPRSLLGADAFREDPLSTQGSVRGRLEARPFCHSLSS